MIKMQILGRRRRDMTLAQHHAYMRDVHGEMVLDQIRQEPGVAPQRYVQNHVFDSAIRRDSGSTSSTSAPPLGCNFVTQVWFDDPRQAMASTQAPFFVERLQPDEDRFVEQSTVVKVPATAVELLGDSQGSATASSSDPTSWFKVFIVLQALPEVSQEVLLDTWAHQCDVQLASSPGLARYVRNVALAVPGQTPAYHVIDEAWVPSEAAARSLGAALFDAACAGLDGVVVADTTSMLLAREHVMHAGRE